MSGHGGARPGAGRKSEKTEQYQAARRAVVERVVTAKRWANVIERALQDAEDGDRVAREFLAPYVMGAPPHEVTLKGDAASPLTIQVQPLDYRVAVAALAPGPVVDRLPPGEDEDPGDGAALG